MILFVILTIMLGAALSAEQGKRYHTKNGYSIIPPEGWIPNTTGPGTQSFSHPTDSTYARFRIKVVAFPSWQLERYVADLKQWGQGYYDEFKLVSEDCEAVNDLGGYKFTYECRFLNETLKDVPISLRGQTIRGKVLCLVDDHGHLYEMMFEAKEDTYDQYLPAFEASLATLRLKNTWMGIPVWVLGILAVGVGSTIVCGIIVRWRRH